MGDTPEVTCSKCPSAEIWLWGKDGATQKPVQQRITSPEFKEHVQNVSLIFADANKIRECPTCRRALSVLFRIPDVWWSDCCKKGNGYFGSQDIVGEDDSIVGMVSWSRFLIKHVKSNKNDGKKDYDWIKVNVFTHWLAATPATATATATDNRQAILMFNAEPEEKKNARKALFDKLEAKELADPFWVYQCLLNEVIILQDAAIWKARDKVRLMEKTSEVDTNARPDYRELHDLLRHALHVVETVAVTNGTIQCITAQHKEFMDALTTGSMNPRGIRRAIHDSFVFYEQTTSSLGYRATSIKDRLSNEIQLSFNVVTQNDAAQTIAMGRLAQADSAAMGTIALVTLTFLPATFVSALFSMSFFNYNPDTNKYSVSRWIGLYFGIAAVVTVVTRVLWHKWVGILIAKAAAAEAGEEEVGISKTIWLWFLALVRSSGATAAAVGDSEEDSEESK